MQKTVLSCLLLILAGCASIPSGKPDPRDPWERFNRSVFKFNETLDRAIAKPVAKGYVKVTPRVVRTGISNAYSNLDTVPTVINDLLQGKFRQAGHDSARFLMNSTLGLGGLFDPASAAPELRSVPMSELSRRRAKVAAELEAAEARWLAANEELEKLAA